MTKKKIKEIEDLDEQLPLLETISNILIEQIAAIKSASECGSLERNEASNLVDFAKLAMALEKHKDETAMVLSQDDDEKVAADYAEVMAQVQAEGRKKMEENVRKADEEYRAKKGLL